MYKIITIGLVILFLSTGALSLNVNSAKESLFQLFNKVVLFAEEHQ